MGATVSNTVTGKTDMLIVGENPGKVKYADALRKGVPIIHWIMFVYLGLLEDRQGKRIDVDSDLLSTTLLTMVVVTDSLYAHYITRGQDLRFYRAFLLGQSAIIRLLRAAWGSPIAGDGLDGPDLYGEPCSNPESCLKEASILWEHLVKFLKENT